MNALEEKVKPTLARKNTEVLVPNAPKQLFRVVVNNYRQRGEEFARKAIKALDETLMDQQQGLPPQPKEYLKFPTYDWF